MSLSVLVTGAGGYTGAIVVRKLLERLSAQHGISSVRALVRSLDSEVKLRNSVGPLAKMLEVAHGDITRPETLAHSFQGINALVIVTGATPKLCKASLVPVVLTKLATMGTVSRTPTFYFEEGQSPELVDWMGQREQVDQARAAGVRHVVLVSSMAGTKPEHFLNQQMNDIVLWKRRAEYYLIKSGLPYTIIHPSGLLPHFGDKHPAPGGCRELYAEVDDTLMDDPRNFKTIPREDLAEICVQCLLRPDQSKNRSFDLAAGPECGRGLEVDLAKVLAPLAGRNCEYNEMDGHFRGSIAAIGKGSCGLCPV